MLTRRQTFRLYPNKTQEQKLFEARRLHCYLDNACVTHRRYEWRVNKRSVSYMEQQNCLPEFKKFWTEFASLNSLSLQATVKRVDLADNAFFQGLRKKPRFTQVLEPPIKKASKKLRRKRAPNGKKRIKPSNRWKKHRRKISKWQRQAGNQRKDWQHKVTSDLANRYDIGVTEKLNTKGMTRKPKKGSKRKKQKSGLNKSILSVGFGSLNQNLTYKIEAKGGLIIALDTKKVKPSQRCPECGTVHKEWAELSNRYHICNNCGFEIERDNGSVLVMYNVATNKQQGLGTSLSDVGLSSSTSSTRKQKHTGSMKQLGKLKRQKSQQVNKEVGNPNFRDSKLG